MVRDDFMQRIAQHLMHPVVTGVGLLFAFSLVIYAYYFRRKKNAAKRLAIVSKGARRKPNFNETDIRTQHLDDYSSLTELSRKWESNKNWLITYWKQEEKSYSKGTPAEDVKWRIAPMDRKDEDYLLSRGIDPDPAICKKGHLFDILGLLEAPITEQLEKLQFFSVKKPNLNRTSAEREINWLMESTANVKKWENRPISMLQQEFFSFMEIDLPTVQRASDAAQIIKKYLRVDSSTDIQKAHQWMTFEAIYTELCRDVASSKYGIICPNPNVLMQAYRELLETGIPPMDVYLQMSLIVKCVIKHAPELKVRRSLTRTAA